MILTNYFLCASERFDYQVKSTDRLPTVASVAWFILGVTGIAYHWVTSGVEPCFYRTRSVYGDVPIDEDAQILRFEDEEPENWRKRYLFGDVGFISFVLLYGSVRIWFFEYLFPYTYIAKVILVYIDDNLFFS